MGQSPKLGQSNWTPRQCRVPFESRDRCFEYLPGIKLRLVSSRFVFSCVGRGLMAGRLLAQTVVPVFYKPDQKNKKGRAFCRFDGSVKTDSHIACRAHDVPLPCRAVNSHMPCCAPAMFRQCRVLRESPHCSRKYTNCQSNSLTDRLFFVVCCYLSFSRP